MMSSITKIELLAPAKDLRCGKAAINCGADAVYIGGPAFGARKAASNPLKEIEELIKYAHLYNAKVYAAVNTILYEEELPDAEAAIKELYNFGADAVIIQDLGILEMDLPPIPLFASTQTNNYSPERIKFLEEAGLKRIILARELSLQQIKKISKQTSAELECFVHGALCVCYSGQCYFSESTTGRSANRGECSQPCRMLYSLEDEKGSTIVKDKYLLSLKDLNLSEYLNDLINAGITSFKIEGRLKDIDYVSNVTAFYRKKLDAILDGRDDLCKSSSGKVIIDFEPDLDKTFNRGYTDYFLKSRTAKISSFNTPKSTGEYLGKVTETGSNFIKVSSDAQLNPGDGICYFNEKNILSGFYVNKIDGNRIFADEISGVKIGQDIYRNFNNKFNALLRKSSASRRIKINLDVRITGNIIFIKGVDEDGVTYEKEYQFNGEPAEKPELVKGLVIKQFSKTSESCFYIGGIQYSAENPVYLPVSRLNEIRRDFLKEFQELRVKSYKREVRKYPDRKPFLQDAALDYRYNVVNHLSKKFYTEAGAVSIEEGFELQKSYEGKKIMTCKYCIKKELEICPIYHQAKDTGPLFLTDKNRRYRLEFDCQKCEMSVIAAGL